MISSLKNLIYRTLCLGPISCLIDRLIKCDVPTSNGWVRIPGQTDARTKCLLLFGLYENPERTLIRKHLPRHIDCIELGSSIGVVSNVISKRLEPGRFLTMVEALPGNVELLMFNTEKMRKKRPSRVICRAISSGAASVNFQISESHRGGSIHGTCETSINLPAVTLDELTVDSPRFSLVMDIEGAEHEVVESSDLSRCECLIVEVHGTPQQAREFISKAEGTGLDMIDRKHSVFVFVRNKETP